MFSNRWALRVVAHTFTLCLAVGCHAPAQRKWEMIFSTPEGEVAFVTASTRDLFAGRKKPHLQKMFKTQDFCQAASWDPLSQRLATWEKAETGHAVRVYGLPDALLAEYPVDSSLVNVPRLSKGGERVAFFCEPSTICVAEIAAAGDDHAVQICHLPTGKPQQLERRVVCHWMDSETLAAGRALQIYQIRADDCRCSLLNSVRGGLCGTVGGSAVAADATCSIAFGLRDAHTGEVMGVARSGHSYAFLEGISPCGSFVSYIVPGAFWCKGRRYIHHLESGRRAFLNVSPRWRLGSWREHDDGNRLRSP